MATILLVDDSKTLLKHLQRTLIRAGHRVLSANTGHKAVQILGAMPVDLILTDLYMPTMDGFELVDAVRAMPHRPPVIVMSSNKQACGIFQATPLLGAVTALTKPFTPEQLNAAILRALRSDLETDVADSTEAIAV